jgi:hypothetical protein
MVPYPTNLAHTEHVLAEELTQNEKLKQQKYM